ncbi:MAG: hypothetical protein M3449_08250, partial [Acidobacteriota bacterium]|nr:hypothetical protein [Acidobacteriota bacterium]
MRFHKIIIPIFLVFLLFLNGNAQETNPVERQVANPITDTPNINPITNEQNISAPKTASFEQEGGDREVVVYAVTTTVEGENGKRILIYT